MLRNIVKETLKIGLLPSKFVFPQFSERVVKNSSAIQVYSNENLCQSMQYFKISEDW